MFCSNTKLMLLAIVFLASLCGQAVSQDASQMQQERYHNNTYEPTELVPLEVSELPIGKKVGVKGFLLVDTSVRLAPTLESYLSYSDSNILLPGLSVNDVRGLAGCFVYVAGEVQMDKYLNTRVVLADITNVTRIGAAYIGARKLATAKDSSKGEQVKCEIEALISAMANSSG